MTKKNITDDSLLQPQALKQAARYFRAINNVVRQQLLHFIHQKGRVTVTEIYQGLQLEQSVASLHLAILRQAALVNTARVGKYIFYEVNYAQLNRLHQLADQLLS